MKFEKKKNFKTLLFDQSTSSHSVNFLIFLKMAAQNFGKEAIVI
jgi:hypothetical protein